MMPHHHWRRICCKEISAHTSYRCPAPDHGHGHGSLLFITTPHHHHHMPQAPTFLLPLGTQESLKRAMMSRSLDLGLSLGLTSQTSLSSSTSSPWNAALSSVVGDGGEARPERAEERTSSPDSTELSSARGKRGERPEPSADDRLRLERAGSGLRAGSDEEDGGDGNGRKKLRLSKDQAAVLEECFKTHSTLNPKQKLALANRLNLRPRQVEVWFQNRRARTKLKQTEVDCEYLKRWCERLAEENKRLEKEVTELRALKAAAPPALGASPAAGVAPLATLTMCPSCRRVAAASPNNPCHAKSNVPPPPAAAAGNVLPSHCQFFPAADLSSQSMWNVAAPVVTRELF